jgi:hypothetical protein
VSASLLDISRTPVRVRLEKIGELGNPAFLDVCGGY